MYHVINCLNNRRLLKHFPNLADLLTQQDRSYCGYCCYSSHKTERVEHLLMSAAGRHCTGTGGVILVRRVVQLHIEFHEINRLAG